MGKIEIRLTGEAVNLLVYNYMLSIHFTNH